jgi:mannitol/fructose-specific phosphotransferase system IIA component (Ntr-type)
LLTLVVLAVGSVGMIAGGSLGARISGMAARESLAIGIAMNTRGAMEIILGVLALRHGIIAERLFVALVIIAILTSLASGSMIQRVLGRRRQTRFHDFLSSKTFSLQLVADKPRDAIVELSRLAADAHGLDADRVSSLVLKREEASSTALPGGFAIPHARLPELRTTIVAVGRSRGGIDFDAPDGKPAHLVFLILTPEDDHQTQLEVLADITTVFTQAKMVGRTLRAASYTEFLAVIKREAPARSDG